MPRKKLEGLVCGKFYPPHKGHDYLIRTALENCDHLTIMVVQQAEQEPPGSLRERWVRHAYPQATVILVDDIYKDGHHQVWADFTVRTLGFAPDIVFSSEKYGEPWARGMGARHIMVDPERSHIPVSASEIREHPAANQRYLNPEVRAYYLK